MNRLLAISSILCCLAGAKLIAAAPQGNAVAGPSLSDAAWMQLEKINLNSSGAGEAVNEARRKSGGPNTAGYVRWEEMTKRRYREEGLRLWHQYPNAQQRYHWLYSTVMLAPHYWLDLDQGARRYVNSRTTAPVDQAALASWDRQYLALHAEFMTRAPPDSRPSRVELRLAELTAEVESATYALSIGKDVHVKPLLIDVLDAVSQIKDAPNFGPYRPLLALFDWSYGLSFDYRVNLMEQDRETENSFIDAMKASANPDVRQLADGFELIASLHTKPMDLRATTVDGKSVIDLENLRGKFVLVDIWGPDCTGCVRDLPRIQAVYDKYRNKGFEVVGVCLLWDQHVEEERARTLKMLERAKITYPNIGIGGGHTQDDFSKKYAVYAVPDSLLLDRSGRLLTNEVRTSNLEGQVRKILGLDRSPPNKGNSIKGAEAPN